jgi:phage terminase large subunit GpA-like protein
VSAVLEWWEEERDAWRPPLELTVSEWADRNRVLDPLTSAEPGPWRTSRTPYLREILDAFGEDGVEQITMMTSTQVGKTEALLCSLGYAIDQDPGPAIFVTPREPDAERIIARRIKPMVESSPSLSSSRTGWAGDYKVGELRFARSILYAGWAHSAASLAGNPCRYAFCDEVDKFPAYAGREADPIDLVRERLRTFPGLRRLVVASTPTTRAGRIFHEWESSDRRRFWLPCPGCGRFQVLKWSRVKWPQDQRDPNAVLDGNLARYACEVCDHSWTDGEKLEALELGVWGSEDGEVLEDGEVVEPKTPNRNRGFHIWAAYSPWVTWSELAAKFLEANAGGDPARLMNFVNSWLGELWEEEIEKPTETAIAAAISPYKEAELVPEVRVLTAGVDVQKSELFVTVWGWAEDLRVYLVLERRVGSFQALEELVVRGHFGGKDREPLPVRMIAIDSRYRTDEVYDFARRHPANVRAVRGVERSDPLPYSTSRVDRHPISGAAYRKSLVVWALNVGYFKDAIAHSIGVGPEPGAARAFHVHDSPSSAFLRQMGSEHKVVQRDSRGRQRERWVPRPGIKANHYWDCAVYAWAAAAMISVPLMTSEKKGRVVKSRRRRGPRKLGDGL